MRTAVPEHADEPAVRGERGDVGERLCVREEWTPSRCLLHGAHDARDARPGQAGVLEKRLEEDVVLVREVIEVGGDDLAAVLRRVDEVEVVLDAAGTERPRLLHGSGGVAWPLISEAIRGVAVTVGAPYYDFFAIIFGLPLVLLMGLAPLIAWRRSSTT